MKRQTSSEGFRIAVRTVCLTIYAFITTEAATYAHHYSDFGITGPYADSVVGATTPFVTME